MNFGGIDFDVLPRKFVEEFGQDVDPTPEVVPTPMIISIVDTDGDVPKVPVHSDRSGFTFFAINSNVVFGAFKKFPKNMVFYGVDSEVDVPGNLEVIQINDSAFGGISGATEHETAGSKVSMDVPDVVEHLDSEETLNSDSQDGRETQLATAVLSDVLEGGTQEKGHQEVVVDFASAGALIEHQHFSDMFRNQTVSCKGFVNFALKLTGIYSAPGAPWDTYLRSQGAFGQLFDMFDFHGTEFVGFLIFDFVNISKTRATAR